MSKFNYIPVEMSSEDKKLFNEFISMAPPVVGPSPVKAFIDQTRKMETEQKYSKEVQSRHSLFTAKRQRDGRK